MNVLLIGSGGREHALAWKLAQSPRLTTLYIAPGNAGTLTLGENVALDVKDHSAVIAFAKEKSIELVVIGPDDPLAEGIIDSLNTAGILAFGPTQDAAKLEWSKAFAKEFMKRHGIPTAQSETFASFDDALTYLKTRALPVVIKADGLALGKGVVIAETLAEAEATLRSFMVDEAFGASGKTVVIEEFLVGKEISVHAFCDGTTAKLFPIARDHKRIGDGNTGPNTGGMGSIAPVSVSPDFLDLIHKTVVAPVVNGMKEEGIPFAGILFPGIMVTAEGIRVLEFNARFGDPETQSYMRLLDTDLLEIMLDCAEGNLQNREIRWREGAACTVVMASGGYPGKYKSGYVIKGLDTISDESVVVFYAGTEKKEGEVLTAGGRVLGVSALGNDVLDAQKRAYQARSALSFEDAYSRTDIGADWSL